MKSRLFTRIFIILALIIFCAELIIISAEKDYQWIWAEKAGGNAADNVTAIAVDTAGNSYITGFFQGTAYFGDIEFISDWSADVFIAKLDNSGNFIWAKSAGGGSLSAGNAIAVDTEGNAYITGFFLDTVYFGDIELISAGVYDVFITKLDNEGNFIWAEKAGGTSADLGNAIAVDTAGNAYITGNFSGTAYLGSIQLISAGAQDVFIAKLDNEGNFIWAEKAGGTSADLGNAIAVGTAGNAYITGNFSGTAYFGSIQLISAGAQDVFIAKLDNEGNFIWAMKAGGALSDISFGIAVDTAGNSYITGYFWGLPISGI